MTEPSEIELFFTKEGMNVRKKVEMPFTGEEWHENLVSYSEIEEINGIELTVNRIKPGIEEGVLKSLRFHVTTYSTSFEEDFGAQPSDRRGIEIQKEFIKCRFAKDILIKTANWLINKGYLKEDDIPIDIGGHVRYLINSIPKHKDGSRFRNPKELKNGMYIETHCSHKSCVDYAKRLLEYFEIQRRELSVIGIRPNKRRKISPR